MAHRKTNHNLLCHYLNGDPNIPPHLSFIKVQIISGVWGYGRVFHQRNGKKKLIISVSGVTCDRKGVIHDKGDWFEWTIQLNHPTIKHKYKILQ